MQPWIYRKGQSYSLGVAIIETSVKHLKYSEADLLYKLAKPLGHIPRGLYITLQRCLLIHVHCFSVHHSQKREVA